MKAVSTHDIAAVKPLIRWAGGKRLIVKSLFERFPTKFGAYFEPMLGSGALFFAFCPRLAVLADVNPDLMNFYRIVRSKPYEFYNAICGLHASKELYYRLRGSGQESSFMKAVRFFYLIRLSWNGLYRVNREGAFNVPFGERCPQTLVTLESVIACSQALNNAVLVYGDFQKTTSKVAAGDFVYLDPPYPKGAKIKDAFDRYHKSKFDLQSHTRLAECATRLADKGAHVLVTEAADDRILELYRGFEIHVFRSKSLIAATSTARRAVSEAIITSYKCK